MLHFVLLLKLPPLFPQEYAFVCVFMQWKEWVRSQTLATKAPSSRSTRVQAAFVKAMCGVLCAALQWMCDRDTLRERKGERLSDNLYWLGISFTNSPPAVAIANRRVAHKIYLKWVVCIYHICIFVSYKAINKPYIRLTAAANSLLGPFWCHGFTSAHSNKPWWKCAVRLNKGSKSAKIHCGECGVWAFVSIFEIYV